MIDTRKYTFVDGVLSWTFFRAPEKADVVRILNLAHGKGLDETAEIVTTLHADFIGFDEKNLLIHRWDEANDFTKPMYEQAHPWLRHYLGDPEAPLPPADDVAGRQAYVTAEIEAWKRRIFTGNRAKAVQAIRVTVDNMEFDGDEVAQTRMARAIAVGQTKIIDQVKVYLGQAAGDATLTPQGLAQGILDTITATQGALTVEWVLADNTPVVVSLDQLRNACEASLTAMGEVWVQA